MKKNIIKSNKIINNILKSNKMKNNIITSIMVVALFSFMGTLHAQKQRIDSLVIKNGSEGANKVLISDANGNATWGSATSSTNDSTTASNGLTLTDKNVTLGGALTGATTVSGLTGTNKLSFTGTGVDAFNVDGTTFSVDATNNRVGIGTSTPNTSSILDLSSTTSGLLIPRMTSAQRKAIASPTIGLQVYDTDLKGIYVFDGTWDGLNVPAGTVQYSAKSTPPRGYLEANGQAVSRTTYAELFAAIGTVFGPGDGSTTFNVPDLRAEFIRGWDNGRGLDPRGFASAQASANLDHNHIIALNTPNNAGGTPWGAIVVNTTPIMTGSGSTTNTYCQLTSPSGGSESRPRNLALLPIIKF
jgi:microcystin-dependent protein